MWPDRFLVLAFFSAAILAPFSAFSDSHTKEAKKQRICAKAEKRYLKLFSKLPLEEDVRVVVMYKYTFCPSNITLKPGETVRWVNVDKRTSHSVWFKQSGGQESQRLFSEEQFEITFEGPEGQYPYLCGPHWEGDDMKGTVRVEY